MTDTVNVLRDAVAKAIRDAVGHCRMSADMAEVAADAALAAAPKAEPVSDHQDIEELIADAIGDSIDMDWTSRDGAKAVVKALEKEGLTIRAQPEAPKAEPASGSIAEMVAELVNETAPDQGQTPSRAFALALSLQASLASHPEAPKVEPEDDRTETCVKCCGNGEIVTDWEEYLSPPEGAPADHATADCPACDGIGKVHPDDTHPAPASDELLEAAEALSEILEAILQFAHTSYGARLTLDSKAQSKRDRAVAAIAKHKGPQS